MPSKLVSELVESEKQTKENIDILIKTDQAILLLVQELQKQIMAYREETEELREELNELYRLIKEISVDASISTVDDLDEYVKSRTDKSLN